MTLQNTVKEVDNIEEANKIIGKLQPKEVIEVKKGDEDNENDQHKEVVEDTNLNDNLDAELLEAAQDDNNKIEVKKVGEIEVKNVGEKENEKGEEETRADEVAKKHLEWLKEKQSKQDQGEGDQFKKVDLEPIPDLEKVFGEGATRMFREWEKGNGDKWPDEGDQWEKEEDEINQQKLEEKDDNLKMGRLKKRNKGKKNKKKDNRSNSETSEDSLDNLKKLKIDTQLNEGEEEIIIDEEDLDEIEFTTSVDKLVSHKMGEALGVGGGVSFFSTRRTQRVLSNLICLLDRKTLDEVEFRVQVYD